METIKKHLKSTFSSYELGLLRYSYLCVIYDVSKFIVLFMFFYFLHLGKEFCIEILFLTSLRNFLGGFHCNHYATCLAFSFVFSSVGIMLSHLVLLNNKFQIGLLAVIILVSAITKPITSVNRPPLSAKLEKIYHCCGMTVLFVYFGLFLTTNTFPYRNLCFWVIVLQTMQLAVANLNKKGEKAL